MLCRGWNIRRGRECFLFAPEDFAVNITMLKVVVNGKDW